jgi:hypothetical protein
MSAWRHIRWCNENLEGVIKARGRAQLLFAPRRYQRPS